ncbi:amino-acid N-acetyltransferase [Propionivibrio sp.]|uniref:amino-acid N-acetyltransferase n=1 Tax=Propionivibrio sp. TaxID=2212460 RepID=UPI0025E67CC8|nr:amino-acid N-acetyltransferase [Propionivibrio sp.]MBK7357221.1 amino-acid N-acetyltransferase [Propionivibrio sp.]MBK8401385.1 amino-acid N-acetyltransferase [Propionivibrio sp.]MBK8745757.1 amino-acid N-acetyltransferase [Propionivibrio sp.]MBK8892612.1 amino-acid N-acetyltransferase [Propionivibrio sp.]MBL0208054.1 amino-acid N-acetyltransferase [Propionivibrio sp.]
MHDELSSAHFVSLFRSVAPYVNLFRGKTFVIAFGGKAISGPLARTLAYDANLLAALGVRLLLVHGARPQIEEELSEKGIKSITHLGYRVTDAATLDCVIDAVGSVYLEIDALLSQGLPDTPMANSTIRIIAGNFITAKPLGVLDGVDMQYAGSVRKIDAEGIRAQLGMGNIVILSCLGASPTGEIFNLAMEEVAESAAKAITADKLIFLTDSQGVTDRDGNLLDELTADSAERLVTTGDWLSPDIKRYLPCAVRASRAGIGRVHLISYNEDGTLLRELFSRDGVGTIITRESLEILRDARPDDISGLVALIEPLEEIGALVRRSRELLEREITRFSVIEHDGLIVGCAALYPYGDDQAELACVAVHPHYRRWGYGEKLIKRIETRARAVGIKRLFVLTTVTSHWFKERGFVEQPVDQLPTEKRLLYNLQRRSKVFSKAV